jgi:glycosyltransferase involved in cell wall biosynthesis
VSAARILHQQGPEASFLLVGDVDPDNRASISEEQLHTWDEEGVVKWLGRRSDIPKILAQANIACLPSYREGLPKSLLEAMAAGLPCVTTDVPGCREVVRNNDNGLLIPPRDAEALSRALSRLIRDPLLAVEMGKRGRARIEKEFSSRIIIAQTLTLYQAMREENG